MRKFTLFLMSLFLAVGAMAQANSYTRIADFEAGRTNSKVYTLKTTRSPLYFNTTQNELASYWTSSSMGVLGDRADAESAEQQFAFLRTDNTDDGKYYMYSVKGDCFVDIKGRKSENPVAVAYFINVTDKDDSNHHGLKLYLGETGDNVVNVTWWSNNNAGGLRYNTNTEADAGNVYELIAYDQDVDLSVPVAAIMEYENRPEEPITLGWTDRTPWNRVETADYTSTVFADDALDSTTDGNDLFVGYIESSVKVRGARTATVTFTYSSGSCALNVLGVEVIDNAGKIVAGDYKYAKAGGDKVGQVYTVSVAEAGTYKVRCYATFDGQNRANATNGNITISFAKEEDFANFSHSVEFKAEYATLHLGYDAAIPAGVEAYVVSGVENGWVKLTEVKGVIPAATPVILKKVGTETAYTFAYTDEAASTVGTNLLKGSIANRYVVGDAYVLGYINEEGAPAELGFGKAVTEGLEEGTFLNNANKAYLPKTEGMNVASYSFRFGEGTTAIENVEVENEVKAIFDLTGRRVEAITAPGIYIVNGKKVLVK